MHWCGSLNKTFIFWYFPVLSLLAIFHCKICGRSFICYRWTIIHPNDYSAKYNVGSLSNSNRYPQPVSRYANVHILNEKSCTETTDLKNHTNQLLIFCYKQNSSPRKQRTLFKKTILLLYVKKKFKKSLYILTLKNSRSLLSTIYTAQSLYCKVNHCLLLLPSLFSQETTSALQKWYKDCSSYRPASCVPSP